MAKPAKQSNTYDPDLVKSLVGRIEGHFSDLDTERGKYMNACRSIRDDIAGIYEEAKARGVPKKELRAFVSSRQKLEAARRVLEELEQEQRATVEMLAEAFGDAKDLPLFANVVKKAGSGTTEKPAAEAAATASNVTPLKPLKPKASKAAKTSTATAAPEGTVAPEGGIAPEAVPDATVTNVDTSHLN